jgi:hypothetical protein
MGHLQHVKNTGATCVQRFTNINEERLHPEDERLQHVKNTVTTPIYNNCNIKKIPKQRWGASLRAQPWVRRPVPPAVDAPGRRELGELQAQGLHDRQTRAQGLHGRWDSGMVSCLHNHTCEHARAELGSTGLHGWRGEVSSSSVPDSSAEVSSSPVSARSAVAEPRSGRSAVGSTPCEEEEAARPPDLRWGGSLARLSPSRRGARLTTWCSRRSSSDLAGRLGSSPA